MLECSVRLGEFERRLLEEVEGALDHDHVLDIPTGEVFGKWKWSVRIKGYLEEFLNAETIEKNYQGDRKKAYEAFIHSVTHSEEVQQNAKRAQDFERTNQEFLSEFEASGVEAIEAKPHPDDASLWLCVARLYALVGLEWEFTDTIANPDGTFDIWQLIRKFVIKQVSPGNSENVDHVLVRDISFQSVYNVTRPEGDFRPLSITRKTTNSSVQEWPEGQPQRDEEGQISDAFLKYLLRTLGAERKIEDPRGYLHFIQWEELDCTDESLLQESGITLDIPFLEEAAIEEWVLWTPPREGFAWNHHLHTEDEVFEYNITKGWPFPDHLKGSTVIFAVRRLDETDFVVELEEYWDTWNDCAITQKTPDGPILLLETIPGMRFRSRIKRQDKVAALGYFRNLVEVHAQGRPTDSTARDLLGLEGSGNPLFAHSLRVIPGDQLYDITWDQPLGRGKNGAVYSALWRKPAGYLATTASDEQQQAVVLKDVASHSSVAKLVKEIDITFASLGGRAVGCVQFLGVATVHRGLDKCDGSQTRDELFLVFEKATQGTIFDFLSRQLKDVTFVRSWYILIDALTSIAGGISSLHTHRVLHRDLHMNNILVTDRCYPNDPDYPHGYDYLISDLGEGKILDAAHEIRSRFDSRASYGALDFRAPEVNGSFGWSPKAETFSFGVIATKLIECRGYTCSASPPKLIVSRCSNLYNISSDTDTHKRIGGHLLPTALRDAIEPCFSHDPADRPSLRDVVRMLEDAGSQFWTDGEYSEGSKDVHWTYWDWKEPLRRGLSGKGNLPHPRSQDDRRGSYDSRVSDDFGDLDDLPMLDDWMDD